MIRPASSHSTRAPRARRSAPRRTMSSEHRAAARVDDEHGAVRLRPRAARPRAAPRARPGRPPAASLDVGGPITGVTRPVAALVEVVGPRHRRDERGDVPGDASVHDHRAVVPPGHRGDRRPLRPEAHDVFARVDDAHRATGGVGELAGRGRRRRRRLAAERAAVGQRRRGLAAGRAPGRVGLEVGGLDPAGGEAHAARHRLRELERRHRDPRWCGDPAPCPRAPAPPAGSRPRPSPGRPRLVGRGRGSRAGEGPRPARRGARRRRRTRRRPGARRDRPAARAPPSSPARRGGGVEIAFAEHARPGAPSIASYTVCHPVHRHRCAARARSKSTRRVLPWASAAATRTRIPGVQNPHCEPPRRHEPGREVVAHRGVEPVDGRHRPAVDARRGRDAGDARFAVDQDRAAPALALGRAPVLHRERRPIARAAPRATTPPGRRRPRPAHRRTRTAPDAQIRSRAGRIGGWLSTPLSSARSPAARFLGRRSRGGRRARTERGGGRRAGGGGGRRPEPEDLLPARPLQRPVRVGRSRNGWCSRCRTAAPRASSTRAGRGARSGSAVPAARGRR